MQAPTMMPMLTPMGMGAPMGSLGPMPGITPMVPTGMGMPMMPTLSTPALPNGTVGLLQPTPMPLSGGKYLYGSSVSGFVCVCCKLESVEAEQCSMIQIKPFGLIHCMCHSQGLLMSRLGHIKLWVYRKRRLFKQCWCFHNVFVTLL